MNNSYDELHNSSKMTSHEAPLINHDEIARLAYLNWEKDGRPAGHDQKYWLEAEQQIKATGHLLAGEFGLPAIHSSAGRTASAGGKLKKPRRLPQTQSI